MTNEIASIYDNAKQGHVRGIKLLVRVHRLRSHLILLVGTRFWLPSRVQKTTRHFHSNPIPSEMKIVVLAVVDPVDSFVQI
jgi:hypothetical protein